MTNKPQFYQLSVPEGFYVENGCCLACMVPHFYAPDLMGFDETESNCFVAKQPTNENEVNQMIKAVWASEVECIRYAGNNYKILKRLAEAGLSQCCDQQQLVRGITPLLRNHVTFKDLQTQSEFELASHFREYLFSQNTEYIQYKMTKIKADEVGASFSFSWFENTYYKVHFGRTERPNMWHVFHSQIENVASRGISVMIDEWLRGNERFTKIRWYTNRAWQKSLDEWQETPI